MQMIASEGWIRVKDHELEYRLFGGQPKETPTIVMLHEGLGSIRTWGEFPRRLAERTGASVLAYSRAGYGASPPRGDGLPLDYVRRHAHDVLPSLLNEIGFSRGLLLGHSDGGSMAAAYAGGIADQRLVGLIMMAPHFTVEPETIAEIRNAREAYLNRDLRQRLARYHDYVDAAFWGWNNVWLEIGFGAFDLHPELAQIRVPTLVLRGQDDRYGTKRQVEIAQETCTCPLQTLIIEKCGHVPHREAPDVTLDTIAGFCRKIGL